MNFTFLHRPEPRKYGYKPRFYVPEEQKPVNEKEFDPNKFGDKLRGSWERKRQRRNNPTGNIRVVVWIAFLLILLLIVAWRFRHYLFEF